MHITRQTRQNLLCPAEETRPQSSSELKLVVLLTSLVLDLVCDLFTSLVHMTEWSRYLVRWTVCPFIQKPVCPIHVKDSDTSCLGDEPLLLFSRFLLRQMALMPTSGKMGFLNPR